MIGRLRQSAGQTFRSIRIRNFRLFFTGGFISQIGNWLTLVAQTLLVLDLTGSGFKVGLLSACQFSPVLLFGAWAGVVADRVDKRKLLVILQFTAMAQSFAMAALVFHGDPPLIGIYALAFASGINMAFDSPARRSFVNEMVPETDVNNAISLNTAIMMSSRIFGPALAGLLVSTAGYGWCFAADGLSYIAAIVSLLMIDRSRMRVAPPASRAKGQVREGLRYVRRVPDLSIAFTMMLIVGVLSQNIPLFMSLLVKQTLDGSNASFTLLYSTISVGSVFGALISARGEDITLRVVVASAAAFGFALCLLATSPVLAVAFILGPIVGGASVWFMTTSSSIVQLRAAPELRGRVLALHSMVLIGSTPIGGPLMGLVCELANPRVGILIGGLGALAAAAYGRVAFLRVLAAEAPRPAAVATLAPGTAPATAADETGEADPTLLAPG